MAEVRVKSLGDGRYAVHYDDAHVDTVCRYRSRGAARWYAKGCALAVYGTRAEAVDAVVRRHEERLRRQGEVVAP